MIPTGIAILGILGTGLAFSVKHGTTTHWVRTREAPASARCTKQISGNAGFGTAYCYVEKGATACTATVCDALVYITTLE